MQHLTQALSRDEWLWALGSLCQLHQIPFDPTLLVQRFPPPYQLANLQHAAQALGFIADIKTVELDALTTTDLPCIAFLKPAQAQTAPDNATPAPDTIQTQPGETKHAAQATPDQTSPDTGSSPQMILIAKKDAQQVLFFKALSQQPHSEPITSVKAQLAPWVFYARPQAAPAGGEDDQPQATAFGFRWFIPELLRHKRIWRDVILASLAIQILALTTPIFTQVIIDKVIVHHSHSTLFALGVGLLMFMVFSAVMTWTRQYLLIHTGNRIDGVLGSRVFMHLFHLPMRYFDHRPTGTLVARLQGVETIREFITGAAVSLILDLPFLFIFLAIMFYYSWALTLIVLVMLIAITVLSVLITPLLRERLNKQFQLGARNQAFLTEYISGMETVKSLQMEPQLKNRYGDYLASYLSAGFDTRRLSNHYNVVANFLEQLQVLAILILGAWIVMTSDNFTIGMLVAFQMFASRLSQPVLRLVGLWQQFQQANIAVKRLGDIMNAPSEPHSVLPARTAGGQGAIAINRVSFRYDSQRPFLYRDFSLAIAPGSCVAIMGPSGSGKSTLSKLLQGFYLPSDGHIQIDGRDIRHLSANELRHYFGVVPQDTQLFSGTIYDNLIMANPQASFSQVVQACQLAEIHSTIETLPQGYQTVIGEHGVGLSGGQKQRLSIARALLKRPKILIFDEATSHLDAATAEHFARTVNQLKGKVTILFITHQLPKGLQVDEAVIVGKEQAKTTTAETAAKQDQPG